MDLIDIVRQAQGGKAIANMAQAFDLSTEQIEAAITALVPELELGIERNALSRGGAAGLVEALGSSQGLASMHGPAMFGDRAVEADGNAILGQILGTKDASRAAAQRASLSSGLSEAVLKMLLPYIAQILIGALANKTQGGLGDILSKIPGLPGSEGRDGSLSLPQPRNTGNPSAPPPADRPAGKAPLPGGFERQRPLPLPTGLPPESSTGRNPYGDLPDIIRGGRPAESAAPSGGWSAKGGVISWIIRAVLLRYGWSILRAIFGGLFRRR